MHAMYFCIMNTVELFSLNQISCCISATISRCDWNTSLNDEICVEICSRSEEISSVLSLHTSKAVNAKFVSVNAKINHPCESCERTMLHEVNKKEVSAENGW